MKKRWYVIGLLVVVATLVISAGIASAFDTGFEEDDLNTPAEEIILPGFTLSSPSIPGSWTVQNNDGDYVLLSDHILKAQNCDAALIMAFESPQVILDFNFGLGRNITGPPLVGVVKVDGWLGKPGSGTLQFSQNHFGEDLGSPESLLEGTVMLAGPAFDHIVLYAPGGCLAIDDLSVPRAEVSRKPPRPQ